MARALSILMAPSRSADGGVCRMTEMVITALITGGLSLLGVIITNMASARQMGAKLDKAQAVTDTKLVWREV